MSKKFAYINHLLYLCNRNNLFATPIQNKERQIIDVLYLIETNV